MAAANLTAARLRHLLSYNPQTGLFTRRLPRGGELAGCVAGNVDPINGYLRIGVDGISYKAHRLAWLYQTGEWPAEHIDHINGIRGDNRWNNLRAATLEQNNQHIHAARADSRSGRRGVSWLASRGAWRATITVAGKQRHLGYFEDLDDAHNAYKTAKSELHPFSQGSLKES